MSADIPTAVKTDLIKAALAGTEYEQFAAAFVEIVETEACRKLIEHGIEGNEL